MCRLVAVRVLGFKHPFVQKRGEMQHHCSDSSQSHTTLCALFHSWGADNNALLTGNQRNTHTSWQYPPCGSEVGICITVWEKPISCMCEKPDVPTEGKRGALSSRQQQQLLWHSIRPCWQSRFVLRAVYWCLAGGSTLLQHRIRPDLMPGSAHAEEIKELSELWEQPERQKDSCLSMSVCCRAEGDIRDFGPGNDKCHQVFGFCNNILFDSE